MKPNPCLSELLPLQGQQPHYSAVPSLDKSGLVPARIYYLHLRLLLNCRGSCT